MSKSKYSKPIAKRGSNNIHHPDYKKAGLGYTRIPTLIAENPEKWGLTKNGLMVYLFLLARVKRDIWFNGETLKKWMGIGREAVSNGLRNLVTAGFCKCERHRGANGRISGWRYAFFAIPTDRILVAAIDAKVAEALSRTLWFDKGPQQGLPDSTNPGSGIPPLNSKELEIPKSNEERKTPDPLREEEGFFDFPFREMGEKKPDRTRAGSKNQPSRQNPNVDGVSNFWAHAAAGFASRVYGSPQPTNDTGHPHAPVPSPEAPLSSVQPDSQSLVGIAPHAGKQRWREAMMELPAGRRFLEILHPEQIPNDAALRSVCSMIRKGQLKSDYVAFLEDKIIRPNQIQADRDGQPLKSIPEILSYQKNEGWAPGEFAFQFWKGREVERLREAWQRVNIPAGDYTDYYRRRKFLEDRGYPVELVILERDPNDPPVAPPSYFYVALEFYRAGKGTNPGWTVTEEFVKPASWRFLLKEATLNRCEFGCLWGVVTSYKDHLPPSCEQDLADLNANWQVRWSALREEIIKGFERIGAKPPALRTNEEEPPHP